MGKQDDGETGDMSRVAWTCQSLCVRIDPKSFNKDMEDGLHG